jgi:glycosyltransferase involved in cell wall biosynthesis
MAMAQVTFLMSTWNAGELIRPAIESVLAQTEPSWRMIVVDDGSSDGTPDIVAAYSDERIRLERMPENAGQTAALNHGLSLVETDWVARLDQDDLAMPLRIERQLAWISTHPRAAAVGSWVRYIDESGQPLGELRGAAEPAAALRALYAEPERNPFAHSAMTYRVDLARRAGGYRTDLHYAQDTALWVELARQGDIGNVPEFLTAIRQHPGQVTHRTEVMVEQMREVLVATEDAPRRLDLSEADARAWRRARVRVEVQLALVALRDRDGDAARRYARAAAAGVRAQPSAAIDVVAVGARTARYRLGRLRSPV